MDIRLYTDGSIFHNGKPDAIAASAALLLAIDSVGKIAKRELIVDAVPGDQTNNRAELYAVIIGLKALRRSTALTVVTDSEYVFWGGKGRNQRKVNLDLWELLDFYSLNHDLRWVWTKGHEKGEVGHTKYNNEVDQAAREYCERLRDEARILSS